jgi:hypothetical protein
MRAKTSRIQPKSKNVRQVTQKKACLTTFASVKHTHAQTCASSLHVQCNKLNNRITQNTSYVQISTRGTVFNVFSSLLQTSARTIPPSRPQTAREPSKKGVCVCVCACVCVCVCACCFVFCRKHPRLADLCASLSLRTHHDPFIVHPLQSVCTIITSPSP